MSDSSIIFREIGPIPIDVITAMAVIGNIQLASRHPLNDGESLKIAIWFARILQERLDAVCPEYSAVIEMGWDPNFDIKPQ